MAESRFSRSERLLALLSMALAAGLAGTLISGCDRLSRELEAVKVVMTGGQNPLRPKTGVEAVKNAHAELLNEIFKVVLLRNPRDTTEFGAFWDVLNQGASLEGVYNGFVHSSIYRRKEELAKPASDGAIRTFAILADELNQSLVAPIRFDESMAKPLEEILPLSNSDMDASGATEPANPSEGTVDPQTVKKEIRFGVQHSPSPSLSPAQAAAASGAGAATSGVSRPSSQDAAEIAGAFRNASLFTLKRVAGDLALKVVEEQKARGSLPKWYGAFAARMAAKKVDFGLDLRNKADEAFHAEWARKNPEDRLIWEVLNRVHRVLNASDGTQ